MSSSSSSIELRFGILIYSDAIGCRYLEKSIENNSVMEILSPATNHHTWAALPWNRDITCATFLFRKTHNIRISFSFILIKFVLNHFYDSHTYIMQLTYHGLFCIFFVLFNLLIFCLELVHILWKGLIKCCFQFGFFCLFVILINIRYIKNTIK